MSQSVADFAISNPNKLTTVHSQIVPWLSRFLYPLNSYGLIPLYFRHLEVRGRENIPTDCPVIVAPTHRSRWDALLTPYAVGRLISKRDLRFMVSANEMKGIQGWFIRRLGGFPVNTNRPGLSSLVHAVELLSAGEMVVIFPEGGIFRETYVHPLKPGVARIALEVEQQQPHSSIKILPVSIQYTEPYPRWKTDVRIDIGQALDVAPYVQGDIKEATQNLTKDLELALKNLASDNSNFV